MNEIGMIEAAALIVVVYMIARLAQAPAQATGQNGFGWSLIVSVVSIIFILVLVTDLLKGGTGCFRWVESFRQSLR